MAEKKYLDYSGLSHYDEKIKEYIPTIKEIYVGQDLPTDTNIQLWIDPSESEKLVEYGIRWAAGASSPTGERVKRSNGEITTWDITYTPNVGSINYNPFEAIDIFNPAIVTDDFGNKFSRFGRFYWAKETIGNYEYIWVCKAKLNDNYHLPRAFKDFGQDWDYVDIGCYEGSLETVDGTDYLVSKSGNTVLGSRTRTAFYNLAKANETRAGNPSNEKYLITTMSEWNEIIMPLMMIVYGTKNTQVIYRGVCGLAWAEANKRVTGLTDTIQVNCGTEANDGTHSFKFLNIENWYGNVWKSILDCTIKDNKAYVCTDLTQWTDVDPTEKSEIFKAVSYTNSTANGYAKTIGYDSSYPDIQLTTGVGGSASTYYCDYYYQSTGSRTVFAGGHLDSGSDAGLFYWNLRNGLGHSGWNIGARLSRRYRLGG